MKKTILFILCAGFILSTSVFAECNLTKEKNYKVSNRLFNINLPKQIKDSAVIKKHKNGIFLYDKESKKSGFGGFAFGISAYKNPSDHAMNVGSRKIGELRNKKGTIYDMVLIQPTDVQFDYRGPEPNSYKLLYNLAETIDIQGNNNTTYIKNGGMKGEDLYKEILKKHLIAIKEKWNSAKLEEENMSYMYNQIAVSNKKNVLNKIGYYYYDTNGDGIDELLIGEIANDNWKGVIYDIYTMQDRNPVHVVSGGSRNRYFVCDEFFICNEYSSGALESGFLVYSLTENSTELFPQVGFKYDAYENKTNPWFISYNFTQNEWDNVSEQKYKERKSTFNKIKRFDFIPFNTLLKQ